VPFSLRIANAACFQGRFRTEILCRKLVAHFSDRHAFLPENWLFARDLVTRFFNKQKVHPVVEKGFTNDDGADLQLSGFHPDPINTPEFLSYPNSSVTRRSAAMRMDQPTTVPNCYRRPGSACRPAKAQGAVIRCPQAEFSFR
jgi:hypothetical protein